MKKAKSDDSAGGGKKRRKSVDSEGANDGKIKPKRPPSGYLLFSQTFQPTFRMGNPDAKQTEIMTATGAAWKSLSEEDKKPFNEEAAAKKQEYEEECERLRKAGLLAEPPKAKRAKTEPKAPPRPCPPTLKPALVGSQGQEDPVPPGEPKVWE